MYTEDDSIKIYYQDGPGTPKDWIGVYSEGEDPNVDELDGFYYTYGATDGYVTVPKKTLKPGRYFCSLFINDSYDEVSERKYFTVDQSSGIAGASDAGNTFDVKFGNDGRIFINGNGSSISVEIIDLAGKVVRNVDRENAPCTVSAEGLAKGVYVVKINSKESENTEVYKFMIK